MISRPFAFGPNNAYLFANPIKTSWRAALSLMEVNNGGIATRGNTDNTRSSHPVKAYGLQPCFQFQSERTFTIHGKFTVHLNLSTSNTGAAHGLVHKNSDLHVLLGCSPLHTRHIISNIISSECCCAAISKEAASQKGACPGVSAWSPNDSVGTRWGRPSQEFQCKDTALQDIFFHIQDFQTRSSEIFCVIAELSWNRPLLVYPRPSQTKNEDCSEV